MPIDSRKQLTKIVKQKKYLNKDFDGFYRDLYEYTKTFFTPDRIGRDFSENSLGGLLLDYAAYIGDVQSFYLDHQFHELSPDTAVEAKNIQRHLQSAGVEVIGAAPAICYVTFYIKVPTSAGTSPPIPDSTALPIIMAGTTCTSEAGVTFELVEDLNFNEVDEDGNLVATYTISDRDANNVPVSFILSLEGQCVSGQRATDSFSVGTFEAFKQFTLSKENVSQIISVLDDQGNEYYEVKFLTQAVVFKTSINKGTDNNLVNDVIEIIAAPYRYIKETSISTRLTTITMGGGSSDSTDNDIVPDPSEYAIPLYGKTTFSRFAIAPGNLLQTSTLGAIVPNSTLTATYRYGGGLNHNIPQNSIRGVTTLYINFPQSPATNIASFVRESIDAKNNKEASGGDDAPSLDDLKLLIPSTKEAQSRVVTKEDLLTRIYTMPSNLGRVFRAAIRPNPYNPLASRLYIICRDSNGSLTMAPDALKKNLSTYLNEYRLIADAIDILDVPVVNITLEYTVVVDGVNKQLMIQNINSRLKQYFNIKNFEIEEPIKLSDVQNVIYNNVGVVSVQGLRFTNIVGSVGTRQYSSVQYDLSANTSKNIIFALAGSMMELKYPEYDISGKAL
jgi:hypothetical protein